MSDATSRVLRFRIRVALTWDEWVPWKHVHGVRDEIPRGPGVYEVVRRGRKGRLTIGKAANLRNRIVRGLVAGRLSHSAGERIRRREPFSKLLVRWAETPHPAAAEEWLHARHYRLFSRQPTHTRAT